MGTYHRKCPDIEFHGESKTRLYRIWQAMKSRCLNPNYITYKHYGGRGIKVCVEWQRSYETFRDWAYLNGYDNTLSWKECTIDRIDPDGNYEPSNCRWIPLAEQQSNRKVAKLYTYQGETKCIHAWALEFGINPAPIYKRIYRGWDIEKALNTPLRPSAKHLALTQEVTA